ncbi:MAG: hypothetical protein AAGI03_05565 [Pseudomonadota bacterium]
MNDDDFLDAALAELSPETRAAATAIAAVQSTLGVRLEPSKLEQMADRYRAPRGAVLALMGWAVDPDRPGGRIDLLLNHEPVTVPEPEQRETLMGLAVCRTLR